MNAEIAWETRKTFKPQNQDFKRFTEIARCFFRNFSRLGIKFFRLYNSKLGGKIRVTQKESSRSDLRAPNNDRLKFYARNRTEIFNRILEARRFENVLYLGIFFNYGGILSVNYNELWRFRYKDGEIRSCNQWDIIFRKPVDETVLNRETVLYTHCFYKQLILKEFSELFS